MSQKIRHDLSEPCPHCSAGPNYVCGHLSVAAASKLQQVQPNDIDFSLLERVISNTWDNFGDILPTLQAISRGEWYWGANTRCKYIEIRIDTRDGGCILYDSERIRISPKQFAYQARSFGRMMPWPAVNQVAASPTPPTPPAEQQTTTEAALGGVHAELPKPSLPRGGFPDLFTERQMRDFADRTHALRMQVAPKSTQTWPSEALVWEALQAYLKHDTNMGGMRAALIVGAAPQQAAPKPAPRPLSEREEIAMVDAAMVEMANIVPPLKRSECARLIRAALAAQGGSK